MDEIPSKEKVPSVGNDQRVSSVREVRPERSAGNPGATTDWIDNDWSLGRLFKDVGNAWVIKGPRILRGRVISRGGEMRESCIHGVQ